MKNTTTRTIRDYLKSEVIAKLQSNPNSFHAIPLNKRIELIRMLFTEYHVMYVNRGILLTHKTNDTFFTEINNEYNKLLAIKLLNA